MAVPYWSYETPQPWEERQGTLADRVVRVSAEAQRVYAQQEALLPSIHHEHGVDPAVADHLADIGKRIHILQENARKPDKKEAAIAQKHSVYKRVIPSRFPEHNDSDDGDESEEDEDGDDDTAFMQGRIETMLMDQEWDTRSWNKAKILVAVETLYEQVEHSDDDRRRTLATTMLVRLLETHESAVDYVESTIPILMNKAFRSLSKIVDMPRMFRVAKLLSVLAEWFAPILSRDNAIAKSMVFLLRESELCARIVQHHWRGVLFQRTLATRQDIDASVRTRLRSMHLIKNVELRHQFKVLRDVMGHSGLPMEAMQAYVKILFHLVKPTPTAVDKNRHHVATADQKRLLGSGMLVVLAGLVPTDMTRVPADQRDARRAITEHVKAMALELTESFCHEADKIIEILKSNVIQRVVGDLSQQLQHASTAEHTTASLVHSCLRVVVAVTKAVWQLSSNHHINHETLRTAETTHGSFYRQRLQSTTIQFLATPRVMETLVNVLPLARQWQDPHMCELVLSTLRFLSGSFGFKPLLETLTRNGGRALEQLLLCFDWDAAPAVVRAAVALFHDMTTHPDARAGFTTAGVVLILSKWCDTGLAFSKNQPRFVLALCGLALLARQDAAHTVTSVSSSSGNLLCSLGSLATRLEALYAILLELVSGSSRNTHAAAVYLHQTAGVFQRILLRFLVQVQPSDMEPAFQTRTQRSISCIVLGRFFKVPVVAAAAFSETTVGHVALSLQCSRLDEVEGKLRRAHSTEHERRLHFLGLKEACKALSRLARCPSGVDVNVTLRPSITSGNVPLLPQAIVCDMVTRLHVLEDLLPLIHVPTDAAEFPEVDTAIVHAATELMGYLRPMPYGELTRQQFLQATASHPHGQYANEKLEILVTIGAPMILHVLKEKTCGTELVATCCTALSQLAATNQSQSLLLKQGAMFIALAHVPEVLYDREASKKHHRLGGDSGPPLNISANVDDVGLLDVPASLFTLLGKLCQISDGRMAMMKAHVIPRVLKRLQLTDAKRRDDDLDVKCQIAVVIRRLAMCNSVEGNTSDLFLHFHVVELLAQIAIDHTHAFSPPTTSQAKKNRLSTTSQRHWRVLDHVVGAIAALAQDVLVCVPSLVQLNVLCHLAPLLSTVQAGGGDQPPPYHLAALQYHVMNVGRAIATYPFGEYHAYLLRVSGADVGGDERTQTGLVTFMDRVKKIAFDFKLELQGGGGSDGFTWFSDGDEHKTIGELARDILRLMRECEHHQKPVKRAALPHAVSPSQSRPSSPQVISGSRPEICSLSPTKREPLEGALTFPALSTKRESHGGDSPRVSSGRSETPTKAQAILVPLGSPLISSVNTIDRSLPHGLDLLSTRPPPKPVSTNSIEPVYTFARPIEKQRKHKERRQKPQGLDETEPFLMLDPLFQNSPQPKQHRRRTEATHDPENSGRPRSGFVYVQQLTHHGHHVQLRAQRSRAGDKYIPALSQIHVDDPTMNVLQR